MRYHAHSKESFEHKLAKELLYQKIIHDKSFSWVTKSDRYTINGNDLLPNYEDPEECVLMEFPCLRGYIAKCMNINNYTNESYCIRRGGNSKYGDGKGYCKCNNCDYRNYDYTRIIHDIAAFKGNRVVWAIEIVATHEPGWEGEVTLDYPVYLIKASWILNQTSNEKNIIKGKNFITDFIIRGNRTEYFVLDYLNKMSFKKISCPKCSGEMIQKNHFFSICKDPSCNGQMHFNFIGEMQ